MCVCVCVCVDVIYINTYIYKMADHTCRRPKSSFFNSYYTEF